MTDPLVKMLAAVKEMRDAAHDVLWEAADTNEAGDAIDRAYETALTAYDLSRPDTLRELLPWLATRCPMDEGPCWGRLDDRRAVAAHRHGLLIVDDAPDAPMPRRHGEPWINAATQIRGAMAQADRGPLKLSSERLLEAVTAPPREGMRLAYVSLGRVVMDAAIVRAWAGFAAEVAPGELRVWHGDEMRAVVFFGEGWTAVVMPLRADSDMREAAVALPAEEVGRG